MSNNYFHKTPSWDWKKFYRQFRQTFLLQVRIVRLREVISLFKNTELMSDGVQGFGTVFFPSHCSTLMWWLICLFHLYPRPSTLLSLLSRSVPWVAPSRLPCSLDSGWICQQQIPAEEKRAGRAGEGWGISFPFPLFSRQCSLQWLYFSTTTGFC